MQAARILPFTLLFLVPASASNYPEMTFASRVTNKCPLSLIDLEMKLRSKIQCSAACLQQLNCLGFCYNRDTQGCLTSNSNFNTAIAAADSAPGFTMYWTEVLDDYHRYGKTAYMVMNTRVTFAVAESDCRSKNVSLSLPQSLADTQNIIHATAKYGEWNSWIGAQDTSTEGNWINLRTGEPLAYMDWYNAGQVGAEPNGGTSENCLLLIGGNKMCDLNCYSSEIYSCEKLVYGRY